MGKVISYIFITTLVLAIVYCVFRGIISWKQGYSWQEMDWRRRRSTSISDFFAASDIGKREVIKNGKKCIEYYAYKDGLPVKTVCSLNLLEGDQAEPEKMVQP
ncbi:hypothetical protein [Methylosarcina fibrata]|uniref:hypothetical protein n=1 Tax=Methylosarcina fibrata TaxID=105972 RepID=UPI0006884B3C|nr:hypothetical protein [Methylosarcina fibrata]